MTQWVVISMATVRIGDLRRSLASEIDEHLAALRRSGYVTIGDLLDASVEPAPTGEIIPPAPRPQAQAAGDSGSRRWIPLYGGDSSSSGGEERSRRVAVPL